VEVGVVGGDELLGLIEVVVLEVAKATHPRPQFDKGFIFVLIHHYKPVSPKNFPSPTLKPFQTYSQANASNRMKIGGHI
jgi:hypothetical protein